jgi:hypothetical protein
VALAVGVLALPSPALALTDFTWSGAAPVGNPGWSNSNNWAGASAPSGAVGTLTFTILASAACTASPPTATCYTSSNDVTGLSVDALSIDDGAPISSSYQITGNAITLGGGGLTAGTSATTMGSAALRLPITLSASQTWSVDGNNNNSQLGLYGDVTGPTGNTLNISLTRQTFLGLNGNDVEVGPVAITSGGSSSPGTLAIGNGKLNATDGSPVSLTNAGLFSSGSSMVGPLTSTRGNIQVGEGGTPAGTLALSGALTLDGASAVSMFIDGSGTSAGSDYSQISASGTVDLANARLSLIGNTNTGTCPSLTVGDTDTLVTTTGRLTGRFAGTPDGTIVQLLCSPAPAPKERINYTGQTVTATVVPSTVPPPVMGKTVTVAPEKGTVLIKLPVGASTKASGLRTAATSRFVPLTAGATVPVGATLDTKHGQVRLSTAANAHGAIQSGHFSRGVFSIQQPRKNPLTTLSMTGGGLGGCHTKLPHGGAAKQAIAARRHRRSLLSSAHGHFRTRGRNSVATVRGTKWSMTDTCAGTLTTVTRGIVSVRDLGLRKTKLVKAGHRYLARAVKVRKHGKK